MQQANLKWIFLVLLALIWGSSFILIKKALVGLNPVQLGALRVLISGTFLLIAGWSKLRKIPKKSLFWITISGFLGTFFPAFLFAFAETEIDSAIASILNSLVPLNTIIIGVSLFGIGTSRQQVIGVVIGFIGTVLLILGGAALKPDQNYFYALFVVLASVMYATNSNIIKKHLQEVPPLAIAAGNFAAIMVPAFFVLLWDGFLQTNPLEREEVVSSLGYLVVLCLFGTAMAKVLYNKLVQMATPVFAASVTYLMPIVAVLWGLLDGERFTLQEALASLLILIGVYWANRGRLPIKLKRQ